MTVRILGSGCSKCKALEQRVRQLDAEHQLHLEIEKVTDIKEIMQYGVLMTPGLVVDGVLKSYGNIPKDEQLLRWLKGTTASSNKSHCSFHRGDAESAENRRG